MYAPFVSDLFRGFREMVSWGRNEGFVGLLAGWLEWRTPGQAAGKNSSKIKGKQGLLPCRQSSP
jgi:hypothetical protein